MRGMMLPISSALAACMPAPEKAAMPSKGPSFSAASDGVQGAAHDGSGPAGRKSAGHGAAGHAQAAQGPIPQSVSAAENPLPASPVGLSPEAEGRRTLSTAFVRVGPDGNLTVETRDGHVLVLKDVHMGPKHYDGIQVPGRRAGVRYRGEYANVAAARPGGVPAPDLSQATLPGSTKAKPKASGAR